MLWPTVDAHALQWHGDTAAARALQQQLAERVQLTPDLTTPRLIAGVDVGFEDGGQTTRAVAVLMDFATLTPITHVLVRQPTIMPYIPGLLSFRELPALVAALQQLPERPDVIMADGQGIAHPRRLGIAAHLGVVLDCPAFGVAKTILTGQHSELANEKGAHVPLLSREGDTLGAVLRSRTGVKPLIISPGHRVTADQALAWTQACLTRYRLPEPTRWADRIASMREERARARQS